MNFYEYHPSDETIDNPVELAARDLMNNGLSIIPLIKGEKGPANVKHVYQLISHPIHEHNFNYYFDGRDVDLGLILTDDMEFIDVDEKYKPGITQNFLKAVEYGWPSLYEKLVIHFTASKGCHLLYRSEVIGGKKVLAKTHAKPNPLAIIERINKNTSQYIKIPPSAGYTCYRRNPLDIQFISAEERNWLSALAMSFNEVHIPEVKKQEAERDDSPWNVFNSQNDWKYIRGELLDRGWSIAMETPEKVTVRRPGDSSHRSSGYLYKDSNILYLHTTSTEFENGKAYSPFGIYCMFYHDNDTGRACRELASRGIGKNLTEEGQFWIKTKSSIQIKYTELLQWYHTIGYRIYNKTIVQVINNVVDISSPAMMKRAFLNEVEFEMKDKMFDKVSKMFSEEGGLMAMLMELDDNFIKDTHEHTWLFFKNLAIQVTETGPVPHDYKTLKGYIWQSDIINRDFYESPFDGCDGDRFIKILGGAKHEQLQEIVGYLISRYKDHLNPRAVILMEDINAEMEGDSQGGSGKGLLFQFVRQYRKVADFDGKNFRPSDPFLFQNVDPDTSIIFIDDVEKNFRFNSLFSILTGSLPINKKNKPQIIVPFERSPKICILSNYSIGGMDMSTRRRKYEFAIVKHFGEEREPIDEFGRLFFDGWDAKEWLKFDNLIVNCCQLYLADKRKRDIGNETENSAERSLISNTSREFVEYMDDQLRYNFFDFAPLFLKNKTVTQGGKTITNAVNMQKFLFNKESPEYYIKVNKEEFLLKARSISSYKNLSQTRLTHWLVKWCQSRNVEFDPSYKRSADEARAYRFISWPVLESDFQVGTEKIVSQQSENWQPNRNWDD